MDPSAILPDRAERERLAHRLEQMVDDADELLRQAGDSGSARFQEARERLEAGMRHARSELATLEDFAAYRARRAVRAANNAVHDHPYATVGLAAGLGLLVALLLRRR